MTNAEATLQSHHVTGFENIPHQPRTLAHDEPALLTSSNSGGILSTVLQQR
jgi:hypothetical protein